MNIKRYLYPLLFSSLLIFTVSCTMQNRLYRPGIACSWNNSENNKVTTQANYPVYYGMGIEPGTKDPVKEIIPEQNRYYNNVVETNKNNKSSVKNNRVKEPEIQVASADSCDQIVLRNGDEIFALVREINQTEIKYKRCDNPGGPTITINKSEVLFIKYANGAKEIFKENEQVVKSNDKNTEPYLKQYVHPGGIISFASSIVGLFIFGIPFGLLAMILGIASVTKISSNPDKFRGKGWGIAGMIIGAIDVIAVLIILASI